MIYIYSSGGETFGWIVSDYLTWHWQSFVYLVPTTDGTVASKDSLIVSVEKPPTWHHSAIGDLYETLTDRLHLPGSLSCVLIILCVCVCACVWVSVPPDIHCEMGNSWHNLVLKFDTSSTVLLAELFLKLTILQTGMIDHVLGDARWFKAGICTWWSCHVGLRY